MSDIAYWRQLGAPHYEPEPLRSDAAGCWTREYHLPDTQPRGRVVRALRRFASMTRDENALVTGYLLGGSDIKAVTHIGFTRDPHPEAQFRTLSPDVYTVLADRFAELHGLSLTSSELSSPFRALVGREIGYENKETFPMSTVNQLLEPLGSLTVRPVHFHSARFGDKPWEEPAFEARGNITDIPRVAAAAAALQQLRFVCETQGQTVVYNLIPNPQKEEEL